MTGDAVDLDGVVVRYGTIEALAGIDIQIGVGERVALVGPSGAGKSTLLSVLAGLCAPTRGSVAVLGADLSSLRGRQRREHRSQVGVVSQQVLLPGALRVIHNINAGCLGRRSTVGAFWSLVRPDGRDEVRDLLARVGLADLGMVPTGTLSGGEQQRVAVARVLHQQPRLVLADEPVSAVDPRLSEDVLGLLCSGTAPWTTIVSLHDPDLARRHTTRMIGLRQGRVVFDAAPAAVSEQMLTRLYRASESALPPR